MSGRFRPVSEKPIRPYSADQVAVADPLIRVMFAPNTWVYRLSNGRIGGRFLGGTGAAAHHPGTQDRRAAGRSAPLSPIGSPPVLPREQSLGGWGERGHRGLQGRPAHHAVWCRNLEADP